MARAIDINVVQRQYGSKEKMNPHVAGRARLESGALDVLGFWPLFAIYNFEVDQFSFLQRLEASPLDARVMHEDVLSSFARNEPITPLIVEPLYFSTGHNCPSM